MDLTTQILELIDTIRNRPSMVIPLPTDEINYTMVSISLEGYLYGIGHASKRELVNNIRRWHEKQVKELMSCGLSLYIKYTNKNESDKDITNKLLDIIESFFLQNPNWQDEDVEPEPIEYYLDE